jgi:TPR repeat protein
MNLDDLGDNPSAATLQRVFDEGLNLADDDPEAAIAWFEVGTAHGHLASTLMLADLLTESGRVDGGLRYYRAAAETGDPEALSALGQALLAIADADQWPTDGGDWPDDRDDALVLRRHLRAEAEALLVRAAEADDFEATHVLGVDHDRDVRDRP